jgi:glycosyltransferase involved in cell wall biosynthesis
MTKIRLITIFALPDKYYKEFYQKDPSLFSQNYETQYCTIMDDCFSFSDFWKKNLEKTGRYEVENVLFNVEPLQKKWAEEHDIKYSNENWAMEIVSAQISSFKPNVLFDECASLPEKMRQDLKKENPFIKLLIAWDGILLHNIKYFAGYDMILSCVKETSDYYSQNGFIGYFFPFGFEKDILQKLNPHREKYDVSFVGSLVMDNNFHKNRLDFLLEISKQAKLRTWIADFPSIWRPFDKILIKRARSRAFREHRDVLLRLALINHPAVYGVKMYQTLADSKITLNMHATKFAGNMRLLEATGVGTCLLTDDLANIRYYFEPDKEIVTYKSIPEAVEKIKYLLSHDKERKAIALAGQKRTLEQYSLEARLLTFADFIEKHLTLV